MGGAQYNHTTVIARKTKKSNKTTTTFAISNPLHSIKSPRFHLIYRDALNNACGPLENPWFTALAYNLRIYVKKHSKCPILIGLRVIHLRPFTWKMEISKLV